MKNQITTKDLMALNELITFEQWAATKFRHNYDMLSNEKLKAKWAEICLSHNSRHKKLMKYLEMNS